MRNNWSRRELIVAFNLYCKTPFTKINASNKAVKELAPVIGRSTGSLAMKLANFARLDPDLQARGIKGLKGGSKGEEQIWDEFENNWEELAFESERILADYKGIPVEAQAGVGPVTELEKEGKERAALVKLRVNQAFFRKAVLASYNNCCCITGIAVPELLVAGHIIPWAADTKNRMNPSNGFCMNALHDRAFDKGLITVTPDYTLKVSSKMLRNAKMPAEVQNFFVPYEGKKISMPQKFFPLPEFLKYHNDNIFIP